MMISMVVLLVEDEYFVLMMMIEAGLRAAHDKGSVLMVIGEVVRALLNAGLAQHLGFLNASPIGSVRMYDYIVVQAAEDIETVPGPGRTEMLVAPADIGNEVAAGYLLELRWMWGKLGDEWGQRILKRSWPVYGELGGGAQCCSCSVHCCRLGRHLESLLMVYETVAARN